MAEIKFNCFSCNKEINFFPGRRDECPQCHSDLHCCKNCIHHDPKVYNECKEPQSDVTREKDRGNFCDFYSPGGVGKSENKKADLLAAAEALFKKK